MEDIVAQLAATLKTPIIDNSNDTNTAADNATAMLITMIILIATNILVTQLIVTEDFVAQRAAAFTEVCADGYAML